MTRTGEAAPNRTIIPVYTRFGKWVVSGPILVSGDFKGRKTAYAPVICDCGNIGIVRTGDLKNGRSTKCRTCGNQENPRNKQKTKYAWLAEEKDNPCTDCGLSFPSHVMQLDHVPERGEKLFELNKRTVGNHWTLDEVRREREKCDLVCSNCHDHRTWERKNGLPHVPLKVVVVCECTSQSC